MKMCAPALKGRHKMLSLNNLWRPFRANSGINHSPRALP